MLTWSGMGMKLKVGDFGLLCSESLKDREFPTTSLEYWHPHEIYNPTENHGFLHLINHHSIQFDNKYVDQYYKLKD